MRSSPSFRRRATVAKTMFRVHAKVIGPSGNTRHWVKNIQAHTELGAAKAMKAQLRKVGFLNEKLQIGTVELAYPT